MEPGSGSNACSEEGRTPYLAGREGGGARAVAALLPREAPQQGADRGEPPALRLRGHQPWWGRAVLHMEHTSLGWAQ